MTDGHHPASGSMPHLQQPPSLVGQEIGNYKITRKLGEGGMGEVYAAEHMHIEKKVAIKLLRAEILSNPEAVQRFRQEARSSSSIGHRNIIAIEDFGTMPDGRIYMFMELLNGAALNDLITTPQPVDRLLNILIQTGHGLAAAHSKGIVHRDMKPENIFVTVGPNNEDVPKLLDFGIAKVAGNDGQNNLTRTGTIFGTPFYMAPEQALGNPIDARTDIYAVGVIMYEVFAGSLPFQGESFMGILTQHITTEPENVSQRAAKSGRSLPPGLAEIITRCMQKNPAQRFSTMDELINAMIAIYRTIAGAGMSTYMEAFKGGGGTSSRMAVPTPGAMGIGGGVAPTIGVGGPNVTPTGMPQMMPPQHGGSQPHQVPSGPYGVPTPTGQQQQPYYNPNTGGMAPVQKKSKVGLIIAIIVGLAVAGGVGAFFIVTNMGEKGGGTEPAKTPDAGVIAGNDKVDAGKVVPNETPDAASEKPDIDAGSNPPPEIDAAATVEIDAGIVIPKANEIPVVISVKGTTTFEVFENGTRVAQGAEAIMMVPGTKRTFVIKSYGYKDKTVEVDGSKKKEEFKLDRVPVPKCTASSCPTGQTCDLLSGKCKSGCTASSCPAGQVCTSGKCTFAPPPPGCTATSCPAGEVCTDGKCKPNRPPQLDCRDKLVDGTNKRCRTQFCRRHGDEPVCQLED